jgi:integrase
MMPGRHLDGLTPEWQALLDALPTRGQRAILTRFLHHCSAAGIAPGMVDEAVMTRFGEALERSLLKSPATQLRDTRGAWNRACRECLGWPDRPVDPVPRRVGYILAWSALAPSLAADAHAYLDRLAGRDPLEELPFRPVNPGTLVARDHQIRMVASALVHRGRDPAALRSLADLVEIGALKEALRYLLDRRGGQSSSAIADLLSTVKAIARHWVKVTPAHLEQISALQRRLEVRSRTLTETNRTRLRQFDDPANVRALLGLPARLLALAERVPARQQHRAALLVQSAVAIELLLMAPVRIDNLAALDLDRHLLRPNRRGAGLHLVIPGTAVKNRQDLEFPLPPESIALLKCYLEGYRPVLATAAYRALFPGRDGGRKARAVLGRQISKAVFQHIGLQVHPHLFRHITAKLYLDANPGSYEVVRRVLGHRSIETTTSYYTGLETAAAVRHFDATILKLRKPNGGDRT